MELGSIRILTVVGFEETIDEAFDGIFRVNRMWGDVEKEI